MRNPPYFLFFILSLLFFSCTPLPEVIGRLFDVYVLTNYPEAIKDTLSSLLEEEILTPQPEKMFRLRFRPLSQISVYSQFPNLFLVGTISDTILRDLIGLKREVVERETFAFFITKLEIKKSGSPSQFFIFVAKDREDLARGLRRYKERIRYSLENHLSERIYHLTYSQGENLKAKERIKKYPFSLKIPKGFQISEKYVSGNFIYLFAHYPDRSIFIYWRDGERELNPEAIITLRDSLTYLYYDGDYVARKYTNYQETQFGGQPAIKLQGVWQNDKEIIGGPFVAYALNYQGRFYLIDGTLYNPGKKKLPNLLQLSVILSTFSPAGSSPLPKNLEL
jgi:hypothetical protein